MGYMEKEAAGLVVVSISSLFVQVAARGRGVKGKKEGGLHGKVYDNPTRRALKRNMKKEFLGLTN